MQIRALILLGDVASVAVGWVDSIGHFRKLHLNHGPVEAERQRLM